MQVVLENITDETETFGMTTIPDEGCHLSKSVSTRLPPSRGERRVCGTFNQTGCCIQIDDNEKAVTDIAKNIRKISQVLFQTWKGWDTDDLFGGWFSWLGGLRK